MKLHQILIGIVLVGLIVTGFTAWLSNATITYGVTDYNGSDISGFNNMEEVNSYVDQYELNETGVYDSEYDVYGSMYSKKYTSASALKNSIGALQEMSGEAIDKTGILGGYGGALKVGLGAIIIISISVGLFLQFIIKSERV